MLPLNMQKSALKRKNHQPIESCFILLDGTNNFSTLYLSIPFLLNILVSLYYIVVNHYPKAYSNKKLCEISCISHLTSSVFPHSQPQLFLHIAPFEALNWTGICVEYLLLLQKHNDNNLLCF